MVNTMHKWTFLLYLQKKYNEMKFESNGLFIGMISYPFTVDGKELYTNIISPFFSKHKKFLSSLCPAQYVMDEHLYCPKAYRMFGSKGLAILALVDDYAFGTRIFNQNHMTIADSDKLKADYYNSTINRFKCISITGASTKDQYDRSLKKRALDTFLRTKDKYPYIGIIRLKVDYRVFKSINQSPYDILKSIKIGISSTRTNRFAQIHNTKIDSIMIECFDNDELTIIAFSNDMIILYSFLNDIRQLTCEQCNIEYTNKNGEKKSKHVFASCHLNLGYDAEYAMDVGSNDYITSCSIANVDINCLCETKPGHSEAFHNYISQQLSDNIEYIITGGTSITIKIPLNKINELEKLCNIKDGVFQKHLRKIKIKLSSIEDLKTPCLIDDNHEIHIDGTPIEESYIDEVKGLLKYNGISKIVREKLLSLFHLYNDCCTNPLQQLYFEELRPALMNIKNIINDLNIYDIKDIERELNNEISAFEEAFSSRMHNSTSPNILLEYGGGIQQLLTSFNYAYRQLLHILSKKEADCVYTRITGAERVSSIRTRLNLNINHIIYPELFATTVWKEISNYGNVILNSHFTQKHHNKYTSYIKTWSDFIKNSKVYGQIKHRLYYETSIVYSNPLYRILVKIIDQNPLKYFISDYLVYHFAFQRDYKMMWHFYLKTLLQTTNSYERLGHMKEIHIIYMLLRLIMVGFRTGKDDIKTFIKEQCVYPFDSLMATTWLRYYESLIEIAEKIYIILDIYGFRIVSEALVTYAECALSTTTAYLEEQLIKSDNDSSENINLTCIEARKPIISHISQRFQEREVVTPSANMKIANGNLDFIVCLLNAYLQQIYDLDGMKLGETRKIKSVPRNNSGEIISKYINSTEISDNMIYILADTTSGFLIPRPDIRGQYFALNTTLYRSLWNCRMSNDNN